MSSLLSHIFKGDPMIRATNLLLLLYNGELNNDTHALLGRFIKVCGASIMQAQEGSPKHCGRRFCSPAKIGKEMYVW